MFKLHCIQGNGIVMDGANKYRKTVKCKGRLPELRRLNRVKKIVE
jgi:hypothetical protein